MELPIKGGATEINNTFMAFDREDLIPFFTRHLRRKNKPPNYAKNIRPALQLLPRTSSEVEGARDLIELDGYPSDASIQLA